MRPYDKFCHSERPVRFLFLSRPGTDPACYQARMPCRLRALILFLVIAGFQAAAAPLSLSDEDIFVATVDACSQMPADEIKKAWRDLWDPLNGAWTPSKRFNELLESVTNQSLAETYTQFRYASQTDLLQTISRNTGYRQALDECYGNDINAMARFNQILERHDRAGKFIGAGTQVASFAISGAVFAALPRGAALMIAAIGLASKGYVITNHMLIVYQIDAEVRKCEKATHQSDEECRRQMAAAALNQLLKQSRDADLSMAEMRESHQKYIDQLEAELKSDPTEQRKVKIKKALAIYRDIMKSLQKP